MFKASRLLKTIIAIALMGATAFGGSFVIPANNREKINLGETPWKFFESADLPAGIKTPTFNDAAWKDVGIPHTFPTADGWYRKHFSLDNKNSNKKIFIEFEGVFFGAAVYINGTFIPGNQAVASKEATHCFAYTPFIVDITNFVKFGSEDNVMVVRVSRSQSADWYHYPGFGQTFLDLPGYAGINRPVWMHITDKLHVPCNIYSVLNKWGTNVGTVTATDASATVKIQTNVENETAQPQNVLLRTQVVDADNNIVLTIENSATIAANEIKLFDQSGSIANPHLWYPAASIYGKPYMYKVFHTVLQGNTVTDVFQSPLGIRTLTWDKNFPYYNGKQHYLWGAGQRYEYPALGAAVPEEQRWRDIKLLSEAGGRLLRPGHSPSAPSTIEASDQYGVAVLQPSGDDEGHVGDDNAWKNPKFEYQRDIIIRDRNHPSIAIWELANGSTTDGAAHGVDSIITQWDNINRRSLGIKDFMHGGVAGPVVFGNGMAGTGGNAKGLQPDLPAMNYEAWDFTIPWQRSDWNHAENYSEVYIQKWLNEKKQNLFGWIQWYLAEELGEPSSDMITLGSSMMDQNRIPKLIYDVYKNAAWVPFAVRPGIVIGGHWNRSGATTVKAWSNCASMELFLNGKSKGIKTPNPENMEQPFQNSWDLTFEPGTLRVEGRDAAGKVVCFDEKKTAGTPAKIVLTREPALKRPDGQTYTLQANGSDAAFILAAITDSAGTVCPLDNRDITFSVSGPGVYYGSYNIDKSHAPFDNTMHVEAGLFKIAVRSTFVPGDVTVSAKATGITTGSVTYTVLPVTGNGSTAIRNRRDGGQANSSTGFSGLSAISVLDGFLRMSVQAKEKHSLLIRNAQGRDVHTINGEGPQTYRIKLGTGIFIVTLKSSTNSESRIVAIP